MSSLPRAFARSTELLTTLQLQENQAFPSEPFGLV